LAILPFEHDLFPVLLKDIPEPARYESMHVVNRRGKVFSNGDAVIAMMAAFPLTRPKAWFLRAIPPLRRKVDAGYRKLAARRGELSAKVPDAEPVVIAPRVLEP
jgi:predicted DCC family thiol-disulfide oxidoreductase YuxK